MPYSRPYASGFQDFPSTTTPINATALNTMDVGIKTANDQFQTVTTAQRNALTPTVGQAVWDSDLKQLMVFMNASGGNAWQAVGNTIICTSTTRPATPFHGQMIYETDTKREWRYDGTRWVQTNTASTTTGVTSANNLIVPPTARAELSSDVTGYTSDSAIAWNSQSYDSDDMWEGVTNPSRITFNTAGIYVVTFNVIATFSGTVTSALPKIFCVKSSTTTVRAYQRQSASITTNYFGSISMIDSFAANDYVYAAIELTGGTSNAIKTATGNYASSSLAATWIGRTS